MVDNVINSLWTSSVVKGKIESEALFNVVRMWVTEKTLSELSKWLTQVPQLHHFHREAFSWPRIF